MSSNDWRYNRLLIVPFHERWRMRKRIERGQPLWGAPAFLPQAAGGPRVDEEPGWQARVPPPPPNALEAAYALLGLSPPVTETEVKKAYWKLAHVHHPDHGGDAAKFAEATAAKDLIIVKLKS